MYHYLTDSIFLYHYAMWNRITMMNGILSVLGDPDRLEEIHTVHNYVNHHDFIVRKGAISSYAGQKMLIPFNMEDGTLICEGTSNPNWNCSAPHGAGRIMARGAAKRMVDVAAAKASMESKDIYASVLPADEAKAVYKDPATIENAIEPTAVVINRIKPFMNLKAHE